MNYLKKYSSPIGVLTIVSDGNNIIGLYIEGQKYYMNSIKGDLVEKSNVVIDKTISYLDRYFNGEKISFDIPLKPNGTEFRKLVWNILLDIPYGEVITYGEITRKIEKKLGKKMSSQAVGGAVGHNPISIIIPCHRVIGSNNSLVGYAGGIDKKKKLLSIEGIDTSKYKEVK